MSRQVIGKAAMAIAMVAWFVCMPVVGYGGEYCGDSAVLGTAARHFLYMWSHANVWHLLGNLFVLLIWKGRLHAVPSVAIAFLCSFIPAFGIWPIGMTVGFSGVLFSMTGIRWGDYCRRAPFRHLAFAEFCMKALPFAVAEIVIPHVNWCIHLYGMLAGFLYGRYGKQNG